MCLKKSFPDCHITWAVDPRLAGIVECCEAVDQVVPVRPSLRAIPEYPEQFEAALDMQGLLKSAICIAKAKANQKLGYHWQREGSWLFSRRVLPDPSSYHVVDQYVDVARAAGGQMDAAEFGLEAKPADLDTVRAKLLQQGNGGKFVAINAGAGWVTKRWPPKCYGAVIDALASEGFPAVLIGGSADREAADEVKRECAAKPVDFLGQTSVRELVALIELSALHIGGDTGSTHLAAALGIPAVGLYSITRPKRSCPYGQIDRCHYDPAGLSNIRPEAVAETALRALAS